MAENFYLFINVINLHQVLYDNSHNNNNYYYSRINNMLALNDEQFRNLKMSKCLSIQRHRYGAHTVGGSKWTAQSERQV